MFLCFIPTLDFFVELDGMHTKTKKKLFCFASFIWTYVFNLVRIKMLFLMQLRPSLCWLILMGDSYQECLQDTSSVLANNVFQIAHIIFYTRT